MNIFEALTWDHTLISHLLHKLEHAPRDAVQERRELFTRVKHVLLPHRRFEEEILYPEILHVKHVRAPVTEAYEGNRTANLLLDDLEALGERGEECGEEWLCTFVVFKSCLIHNMREEEGRVFLEASRILGPERAQDMADRYKQHATRSARAESARTEGPLASPSSPARGTPFARTGTCTSQT